MSGRFLRRLVCAWLLGSGLAQAQTAAAPGGSGARTRFNEGLTHVERGEFDLALADFEAAYALKPHYSVLYNIGQAQASLGRPVQAIRAFERYLAEGGNRLSQSRRDEVRALIAQNRAKLGELRLSGLAEGTRVWVDGQEVEKQLLQGALLLIAGKHAVLSSNGGGFPKAQDATVQAGSVTELALETEPALATAQAPRAAPARLRVLCELAGVNVNVAGATLATTPVPAPLIVTSGLLTVRFSRAGYRPVTHQLVASPTDTATVTCDQVVQQELPVAAKATLVVQTVPFDAQLFVDGSRFLGGPLPYGPHELQVARDGFVTQRRAINLRPSGVTTYQVTLEPTPAHRAERARDVARRKGWGYASGGGGLALLAASAVLYGWNDARYRDWRRERAGESVDSQLESVTAIQRVDDVAAGCAVLGVGLLAAGAWLLLSEPATTPSR